MEAQYLVICVTETKTCQINEFCLHCMMSTWDLKNAKNGRTQWNENKI